MTPIWNIYASVLFFQDFIFKDLFFFFKFLHKKCTKEGHISNISQTYSRYFSHSYSTEETIYTSTSKYFFLKLFWRFTNKGDNSLKTHFNEIANIP